VLLFLFTDITKKTNWVGHNIVDSMAVLATLQEPLVEKAKSYKAVVTIEAVNIKGEWKEVTGKSLVYLNKDSSIPVLNYGSQIVFYKPLQPIKNSGNPGAFDYKRYNAFQDIYHQVFLKTTEYQVTQSH
jgi:competence protein ComEC